MLGLPYSLLKAAPPSGPSIMILNALQMRSGVPTSSSHGWVKPGIRRLDTVKPMQPALGREPVPHAPSSRISPPEPVEAPGYGDTAVGWLWVSTLHTMWMGSCCVRYAWPAPASGRKAPPGYPVRMAPLSL